MLALAAIAAIAVAFVVGTWLHDTLAGERLWLDLVDEWRLARQPLADADARWRDNPHRSDAIICLTTIPSRLPLLADTLKSLMRQTHAARIELHVPRVSEREGAYVVPPWLRQLQAVTVVDVEHDFGPATKLYPALSRHAPDQLLIVVDDDRIQPAGLVERFDRAAALQPDSAFAGSGWRVPHDLLDRPTTLISNLLMRAPTPVRAQRVQAPYPVDILQGCGAYAVRPRFFDWASLSDYSAAPSAARWVDDVWISLHCKTPKWVLPAQRSSYTPKRHLSAFSRSRLGRLNRGTGGLEARHNTIVLRHFFPNAHIPNGTRSRTSQARQPA